MSVCTGMRVHTACGDQRSSLKVFTWEPSCLSPQGLSGTWGYQVRLGWLARDLLVFLSRAEITSVLPCPALIWSNSDFTHTHKHFTDCAAIPASLVIFKTKQKALYLHRGIYMHISLFKHSSYLLIQNHFYTIAFCWYWNRHWTDRSYSERSHLHLVGTSLITFCYGNMLGPLLEGRLGISLCSGV